MSQNETTKNYKQAKERKEHLRNIRSYILRIIYELNMKKKYEI